MDIQKVDPQGYEQFRKFATNMLRLSLKEPLPIVNDEGDETCQNVHHQGQTTEKILEVGISSIEELLMCPHGDDSSCDNPLLDVFLGLISVVCQSGESVLTQLREEHPSGATSQ